MLLILFWLFASAAKFPHNLLTGTWQNQLGSIANFEVVETGIGYTLLEGNYTSAVGDANGTYYLSGLLNSFSSAYLFSWIVVWNNRYETSESITTWIAYADLRNHPPIFDANWMLVRNSGDSWNSTLVGQDTFFKV